MSLRLDNVNNNNHATQQLTILEKKRKHSQLEKKVDLHGTFDYPIFQQGLYLVKEVHDGTLFDFLPVVAMRSIFSNFNDFTLVKIMRVCKEWQKITTFLLKKHSFQKPSDNEFLSSFTTQSYADQKSRVQLLKSLTPKTRQVLCLEIVRAMYSKLGSNELVQSAPSVIEYGEQIFCGETLDESLIGNEDFLIVAGAVNKTITAKKMTSKETENFSEKPAFDISGEIIDTNFGSLIFNQNAIGEIFALMNVAENIQDFKKYASLLSPREFVAFYTELGRILNKETALDSGENQAILAVIGKTAYKDESATFEDCKLALFFLTK